MQAKQQADVQPMLQAYCQTRDIELRNELVEHYLYIARMVAGRFVGRGVEYDDLLQVASLALVKALERFDDARGLQFVTYATPTVVGEVRNHIRDRAQLLRIPRRGRELYAQIAKAREELSQQLFRQPDIQEIATFLKVSADDVLESLEMHHLGQTLSLDAPLSPDEDDTLEALLGGEEGAFEAVETRDLVERVLKAMPERERFLVEQRVIHQRSQRDVAKLMNISQMQVSRLERRIFQKLRETLAE